MPRNFFDEAIDPAKLCARKMLSLHDCCQFHGRGKDPDRFVIGNATSQMNREKADEFAEIAHPNATTSRNQGFPMVGISRFARNDNRPGVHSLLTRFAGMMHPPYIDRFAQEKGMNWRYTFTVGFGFFGISIIWPIFQ